MNKKKSLSPKLDVVFQALFGEVGSEKITTSLLKAILKQNIEEIDLNQNPILRREFKDDKLGILDILAKINGTDNCNIELQIVDRANIIERMLYYWGRLYTRGIQAGEDYAELVRTVVVLITEFDVLPEENLEIHTNWKIIEEKHRKTILTDKFEFHIIIMSKIEEANLEDKELLDWLYFLDNPESEKVKNIMKTNKELKEAGEKLNKISQDEKLRKIAELRQKAIMDEKAIFRRGQEIGSEERLWERQRRAVLRKVKKNGLEKGKKDVAKKMKQENIDLELIIKVTGLSKEQIEDL